MSVHGVLTMPTVHIRSQLEHAWGFHSKHFRCWYLCAFIHGIDEQCQRSEWHQWYPRACTQDLLPHKANHFPRSICNATSLGVTHMSHGTASWVVHIWISSCVSPQTHILKLATANNFPKKLGDLTTVQHLPVVEMTKHNNQPQDSMQPRGSVKPQ